MLTVVFAHYSAEHHIRKSDIYYLTELKKIATKIIFVSTSNLNPNEKQKLKDLCDVILTRPNQGLDFCSYQLGLRHADLAGSDRLLLANDSVYGPIYPIKNIYQKFEQSSADAYGQTISYEHQKHLQSYFMLFKPTAHQHPAFQAFWQKVEPLENKKQIIQRYEIGLTQTLEQAGLLVDALYNQQLNKAQQAFAIIAQTQTKAWAKTSLKLLIKLLKGQDLNLNPTHHLAKELIKRYNAPLLKKELMDKNPHSIKLKTIQKRISAVQTNDTRTS
ncbi:hypothetical protein JX580_05200 [Thiomicrospira microaerophila]|uniref:rhamnan synthesis F family protein n=1 Tax=Thiomicrospira microaerophila TaxID=406020 RepID=UPI00200E5E11|nr:rhamnan synthesis F family protein [Thiomicrospira microaerophila]UQB43274.1 hypothetical protein JX580_05200 [Thiomicrospira microaerophila]